jgi:hypothetical protein
MTRPKARISSFPRLPTSNYRLFSLAGTEEPASTLAIRRQTFDAFPSAYRDRYRMKVWRRIATERHGLAAGRGLFTSALPVESWIDSILNLSQRSIAKPGSATRWS